MLYGFCKSLFFTMLRSQASRIVTTDKSTKVFWCSAGCHFAAASALKIFEAQDPNVFLLKDTGSAQDRLGCVPPETISTDSTRSLVCSCSFVYVFARLHLQ